MNQPPVKLLDDVRIFDVSWVDKPLYGFAKIVVLCSECEKTHRMGEHPNNGCRMGVVDNVMKS